MIPRVAHSLPPLCATDRAAVVSPSVCPLFAQLRGSRVLPYHFGMPSVWVAGRRRYPQEASSGCPRPPTFTQADKQLCSSHLVPVPVFRVMHVWIRVPSRRVAPSEWRMQSGSAHALTSTLASVQIPPLLHCTLLYRRVLRRCMSVADSGGRQAPVARKCMPRNVKS